MGKQVKVYIEGGSLVAFTSDDGKKYSSTKPHVAIQWFCYFFVLLGILTIPFLGIGFLFFGWSNLKRFKKMKAGAELPNDIQIPNC